MRTTKNSQRGIISLAVILGVGIFGLAAALASSLGALSELRANRNVALSHNAFYAADAATREGAYQYINATTPWAGGAFPELNSGTNSSIVVQALAWPYEEIRGTADSGQAHRTAVYTITVFPEGFAFDNAVYAQDDLLFGGNAQINGDIFANGDMDFNGNAEIDGNAYSPTPITDTNNITGEAFSGTDVDSIPPPQIDTQPYRDAATTGGTLFAASSDAEDFLNNQTRNAVVFVEDLGDTKIQGNNTELTGSIVTLGNLEISGGTYTASDNYAAIVVMGDLKIAGGATINGIIYVAGATSFGGGNNTIKGSLISVGGANVTSVTGSATINFDPTAAANWQLLEGLITTSAEDPKIVKWGEV